MGRAARLHRLVMLLSREPRRREAVLDELRIGLRTFYRELKLLKKCGIKVQRRSRLYALGTPAEQVEGRLPFPDPQLNFAEMAELSRCPGKAAQRLAELLAGVIQGQQRSPGQEHLALPTLSRGSGVAESAATRPRGTQAAHPVENG